MRGGDLYAHLRQSIEIDRKLYYAGASGWCAMINEIYTLMLQFLVLTSFFWAATFGAFVLYILNRLNKRQPFSLFSALDVPMKDRPGRAFGDMMISSGIGGGIVLLLLHPTSAADAGAAGLGLTGILSAFGKDTS
jgi:hypothetical protein